MLTCPVCNSENVYFSKKRCCCICEDCGKTFREDTKLKLFFSYGHDKHKDLVDLIRKRLEERGHVVWIDHNDIEHNDDWRQEITKGVIGSDEIISFMSKHSLRNPGVCLDEVQIAISIKNERVIRIHLEETKEIKPSTAISSRQYLDMKDWETYYKQGGEVWNEWFDKKMSELIRCIEDPENAQFDGEITELSRKLHPIDYLTRARILLKDEFRGRKWLLAKYGEWKNSSDSNMFALYGIPGAGKSAFASRLFDEDYDVIASVFFEFNRKDMSDLDNITNVIAFQIACKLPDYREYLLYCLNNDSTFLDLKGITRFDSYILTPLRNCIVGSRDKQIIIIDSLDEAYDLNKELVVSLLSRLKLLPRWIKVLVTSRYNSAIDVLLDNAVKTNIEKETKDNNSDLKAYLSDHFENFPRINELVDKCEGSFLYASMLCQKASKSTEFAEELLETNGGLDSFYYLDFRRKFNSDNGSNYSKYRPILELICTTGEISDSLICDYLKYETYVFEEFKRLYTDYILIGEESFSVIDKTVDKLVYLKYSTVKLFHKSLYDWLTNPLVSNEFYIDIQHKSQKFVEFIANHISYFNDHDLRRSDVDINSESFDYIFQKYYRSGEYLDILFRTKRYQEFIDAFQNRVWGFPKLDYPNTWCCNIILFPIEVDITPLINYVIERIQHEHEDLKKEIYYQLRKSDWFSLNMAKDSFHQTVEWYHIIAYCLCDSRLSDIIPKIFESSKINPLIWILTTIDFDKPLLGAALSDCLDQIDYYEYDLSTTIRNRINMHILCSCFIEQSPSLNMIDSLRDYKTYHYRKEICDLSLEDLSAYHISDDLEENLSKNYRTQIIEELHKYSINNNDILSLRNYYNSLCLKDYLLNNLNKALTADDKSFICRLIEYGADYNTVLSLLRINNNDINITQGDQTQIENCLKEIWEVATGSS